MVEYVYDAWGNHAVLDANGNDLTSSSHIGNRNPFRYRGYFYDVETGLYYLQTRYYDPEIGRFLNMDDISYADPEQFHGLNLYAYCGNDPVNNVDPTGHEWWEFWKWDWAKIGGWILVGAMTLIGGLGAIAGTFVIGGIAGAIIAGAGMGMLGGICSSIEQNGGLIHMSDMDPWKIAKAGGGSRPYWSGNGCSVLWCVYTWASFGADCWDSIRSSIFSKYENRQSVWI